MLIATRTIARALLLAAAIAGVGFFAQEDSEAAEGEAKPAAKIEFAGWFSNPVFSADGKVMVYAQMAALPFGARTGPTQLVLWDVVADKEIRKIEGPADDSLLGPIALSPDGKRLAMGLWNTAVRVVDLESGKEVGRLENSNGAQHLRFSPDGRVLGWVRNGEVYLADAATLKELRHLGKDESPVGRFVFANEGKSVLTGHSKSAVVGVGMGKNPTVKHELTCVAWDAGTAKKLHQVGEAITDMRLRFEGQPELNLLVSADGKKVTLAGDRGGIQVCDAASGKKEREVQVPWKAPEGDPIRKLALSANGQVAAVGTGRGVVSVWDLATGKELRRVETGHSLDHLALSPDGKTLAVTYQIGGRVGAELLLYKP
jgi:WD40 repeat protein